MMPHRMRADAGPWPTGVVLVTREDPRQPVGPHASGWWLLWRKRVGPWRAVLLVVWYAAVVAALVLADFACLLFARLPVSASVRTDHLTVHADGQTLAISIPIAPSAVVFVSGSSLEREFQIDGTDSTNNFTESMPELQQLAGNPYYQFQAWMRGNATYSQWREITVSDAHSGRRLGALGTVSSSSELQLPVGVATTLSAYLERPESPARLEFMAGAVPIATLSIDRNTRTLALSGLTATGMQQTVRAPFFPERPGPFAAEVVDTLVRVSLWATLLLGAAVALAVTLALLIEVGTSAATSAHIRRRGETASQATSAGDRRGVAGMDPSESTSRQDAWARWWGERPVLVAAGILAASFAFVAYVALVQYHAEPHILDASAYFFQAKIFASGQLAAPIPRDLSAFQGPFMVAWHGRWFAQYAPATSAVLAIGIVLHVPWLVEPLLGTAALWGMYLLGRRMYGPWTGVLAVGLAALSPFYAYLAASYLSHTVALVCAVYYVVFLLRFVERRRVRDLGFAAGMLGAMFCARELSAAVVGIVSVAWVVALYGRDLWRDRGRVLPAVLVGGATLLLGVAVYFLYNWAQTGSPVVSPRTLFSPADRYGFGDGVGFYGKHTLAAGLVNLDQLLIALLIDLYGWPFYLTLALVPLALLRGDTARRWDWLNLSVAAGLALAMVGYFYHGIYLGPRYLYEAVPFLALLTARGILALAVWCQRIVGMLAMGVKASETELVGRVVAGALLGVLILCNLGFYLPRQLALHRDFSGLPANRPVDVAAIYRARMQHALIVTDDSFVYNYVLWPLNDPDLRGNMLYALAPTPEDMARLHAEYPDRTLYYLALDERGQVSFQRLFP